MAFGLHTYDFSVARTLEKELSEYIFETEWEWKLAIAKKSAARRKRTLEKLLENKL